MHYQDILNFWFGTLTPMHWWKKDRHLDQLIRDRFKPYLTAAQQGELYSWRRDAEGALAEIIVLDQFSRNIYRDAPESFASDGLALGLAQMAVEKKLHLQLPPTKRAFMLMPYMHSESMTIHEVAVTLFYAPGMENNYDFELKHKAIIERFGRYPHRNDILGRVSTDDELAFLKMPGSSF